MPLSALSVQIGQVMLTLPHAVALVGLKSAIPLMVLYGFLSTCGCLFIASTT